jgi:DNA invertase Pin-like site-specific DNA recombinase
MATVRRGDHIVVARHEVLDRSLVGCGSILALWEKLGVVAHLCVVPGDVPDTTSQQGEAFIKNLVWLAEQERHRIRRQTGHALAALKDEGKRYCRHAPRGFKWQRRGKKKFMVPDPSEQALCIRVAELRSGGYSLDQVRQFLAYALKVRNRNGNEFGKTEVRDMALRGAQFRNAGVVGP